MRDQGIFSMGKKYCWALLILGFIWILVALILFPAIKTFQMSIIDNGKLSMTHYIEYFSHYSNWMTLRNSIVLGLLTVLICGGIGSILAFCVHFFECPKKSLIHKMLLTPMMLPGLIIVFAFIQLYGESGIVTQLIKRIMVLQALPWRFSGLGGILFVHGFTQYVFFYLNVSIGIQHIDMSTIEAARNMGASKIRILKTIVLPFLRPAMVASSIVTFMSGIGSFSAPSLIGGGYRVMTVQILMSKANNYMSVAAMQVVLLSLVSMCYLWLLKTYRKGRNYSLSVRGVLFKPLTISPLYKVIQYGLLLILIVIILLPIAMIIVASFIESSAWMVEIFPHRFTWDNYIQILTKARAFRPFKNSVIMAAIAGGMALFIGIPSAAVITKSNTRVKILVDFLVMLPWAMPASAIAINTINAYNKPSIFSFNTVLVGTYLLLPLAYFVNALPLMVRTLNVTFEQLNNTYLDASKSLGAGRVNTFRKIVLPMIAPGMVGGFLLVFIRSIGEYTMSVFLYTVSNKPIAIAMVNGIFEYDIGLAMAYGSLLVFLSGFLSFIIYKLLPQEVT